MESALLSNPWTWLAIGYLLGSVPFGLLVTGIAGKGDVRKAGSGNIGTTNVLRVGGKGLAALTLLLDAGKGAVAVWLGARFAIGGDILGGMGAFIGHCFPIFLAFRGGKGVATYLGVALALEPLAVAVFALTWVLVAAIFRFSSLAGLAAAFVTPFVPFFLGRWDAGLLLAGMTAIVIAKHEANIARLLRKEEPKIGRRADVAAPGSAPADAEPDPIRAHDEPARGPRIG